MTNRLLAGLTGILVFMAAGSAFADSDKTRFIAVEGKGTVTAVPDIASINTGVTTRADTARAALSANNKAMSSLFRQLSKAGIDERISAPAFLVSRHIMSATSATSRGRLRDIRR